LKQHLVADKTMTEPTRHLANTIARAGRSVWLHGFEIRYTFDIPSCVAAWLIVLLRRSAGSGAGSRSTGAPCPPSPAAATIRRMPSRSVLVGILSMVLFRPRPFPAAKATGEHGVHDAMLIILASRIGLSALRMRRHALVIALSGTCLNP
jgi:hypothetical protein